MAWTVKNATTVYEREIGFDEVACENIRFSSRFVDGDVSRKVPGGEERGETDVFAGYDEGVAEEAE